MSASAVRHQYDASLALQAPGSVAITATAPTSALDLYEITGSPYGALNGLNGLGSFDLVLYVGALDHTTGDETYTVQIEVADEAASWTVVESFLLATAQIGEVLAFPLQPATLAAFAGDAAQIRLNVVLAGTTPSLTYWAFLAPQSHA
jgi:hypothetical protein